MENRTYNPFPNIGKQYTDGLDFVIANLPTTPSGEVTFQGLNDTVVDYLESLFSSSFDPGSSLPPVLDNLVYSILPNAANSYQNSNLPNESFYNETQVILVNAILNAVKNNSVEGITAVLNDADNEIAQSGLSAVDQAPLFVAVEIGRKSFEYWQNVILAPPLPPSNWSVFINNNPAINTANLPFWVAASMEGALSGYAQIQQLNMAAATSLNSLGRAVGGTVAMVASVGLSAGKVIFKWVQKPIRTVTLSRSTIANLGSGVNGGNTNTAILSGGCTDGCTGSATFASWWRCTKADCTGDCEFGGSVCVCQIKNVNRGTLNR